MDMEQIGVAETAPRQQEALAAVLGACFLLIGLCSFAAVTLVIQQFQKQVKTEAPSPTPTPARRSFSHTSAATTAYRSLGVGPRRRGDHSPSTLAAAAAAGAYSQRSGAGGGGRAAAAAAATAAATATVAAAAATGPWSGLRAQLQGKPPNPNKVTGTSNHKCADLETAATELPVIPSTFIHTATPTTPPAPCPPAAAPATAAAITFPAAPTTTASATPPSVATLLYHSHRSSRSLKVGPASSSSPTPPAPTVSGAGRVSSNGGGLGSGPSGSSAVDLALLSKIDLALSSGVMRPEQATELLMRSYGCDLEEMIREELGDAALPHAGSATVPSTRVSSGFGGGPSHISQRSMSIGSGWPSPLTSSIPSRSGASSAATAHRLQVPGLTGAAGQRAASAGGVGIGFVAAVSLGVSADGNVASYGMGGRGGGGGGDGLGSGARELDDALLLKIDRALESGVMRPEQANDILKSYGCDVEELLREELAGDGASRGGSRSNLQY